MNTDQDFERLNEMLKDHFTHIKNGYLGTGVGWHNLLYTLMNCIDNCLDNHNKRLKPTEEPAYLQIDQIKEKFGGLRFYATTMNGNDYVSDSISGMIDMAEAMSYTICEECGQPGKLRSGGWIRTLCDVHEAKRQEYYKGLNYERL